MNHFRIPCVILAALYASLSGAAGQVDSSLYREGEPETIAPQPKRKPGLAPAQAELIAAFKAGYVKAGKPRIALFWNRDLDDTLSSTKEAVGTVTSTGPLPRQNYEIGIKFESKTGSAKAYSLAPPPRAAEFESGFQAALRSAGAVFVDRNTIVRLAALAKTKNGEHSKDLDFQTIEMSALADYAQYFAEINFIRDPDAKGGLQVRATIIGTKTGEVIADVVPTDLYKPDEDSAEWTADGNDFTKKANDTDTRWVAGASGFEKVERRKTGLEEGRAVAFALMEQMVAQF